MAGVRSERQGVGIERRREVREVMTHEADAGGKDEHM